MPVKLEIKKTVCILAMHTSKDFTAVKAGVWLKSEEKISAAAH